MDLNRKEALVNAKIRSTDPPSWVSDWNTKLVSVADKRHDNGIILGSVNFSTLPLCISYSTDSGACGRMHS